MGFPHSVAAARRHLSPLRTERKGAWFNKLAPFLSPVVRGRGVRAADGVGVAPSYAICPILR
ncbi:MAG: hypothetical protein ABS35_38520 [Kaistia sp. SCN 65-12]|nr:MAG: hypothetical protein ABS35_38520 [Kaistia sp. SCN 65-12]